MLIKKTFRRLFWRWYPDPIFWSYRKPAPPYELTIGLKWLDDKAFFVIDGYSEPNVYDIFFKLLVEINPLMSKKSANTIATEKAGLVSSANSNL